MHQKHVYHQGARHASPQHRAQPIRLWRVGTILLLLAALLSACGGTETDVVPSPSVSVEASLSAAASAAASPMATVAGVEGGEATIAEIVVDPTRYLGQTITVIGEIEEVIAPTVFSIDDNAAAKAEIGNDLLVFGGQQLGIAVTDAQENRTVQVTGTLREFTVSEIEGEIGMDLDEHLFNDRVGRPVLVVETAVLLGGPAGAAETATAEATMAPEMSETATAEASMPASAAETPAAEASMPAGAGGDLTVAQVVGNMERYLGQQVTVRGDVDQVLGPNNFILDENAPLAAGIDSDLLVVSPSFTTTDVIADGDVVEVVGVVRRVASGQAEGEPDLDLGLDATAAAEREGRAILVAAYVRPIFALNDADAAPTDQTMTEQFGRNITVAEVTGNLDVFQGKRVTVRGDVQALRGNAAFVLDEDAPLAAGVDNDLLVVSATSPVTVTTDNWVDATGTVRVFDLAQIEQEIGMDLEDEQFADDAGRPVLVADSITVSARVADIVADPAAYVGRTVTVLGEVEARVGPGLFSLDEDAFFAAGIDNDLLVVASAVGSDAIDQVEAGQMAQIKGVVRQLVTVEFEREFGLDLDDELVADFEGRPVIMASAVQLAPRD